MNKIISLAFFLCTLFVPVVSGAIIEKPLNMATKIGGETFFNCSSNTTDVITWLYGTDFNTATSTSLTVSNCQIGSSYASHYKTEKTGFTCNLIVFNTLLSHGGIYTCADGLGVGSTFQAILIIVDPNATITTNTTELISEEDAMISNKVSYRGPLLLPPVLPPSFYWTLQSDTSQNITSYAGSTTESFASSYIVVTAEPPKVPPYLCNLFFNSPNNVPASCATNAPTYRTSWETPNYNVLYAPANVSIPENFTACPIDEPLKLTCSADGYPVPTYKWSDLTRDVIISESNTVIIQQSGSYECVASNTIRDMTYSASAVANVSDCFTFVPESTPLSTAQCEDTCVVVVGFFVILFGLNFFFSIGFIGVYGCSKACRNKLNDRFPWLKKMLPCMNDEGCKCSMWICLFVVLAVFTAIVFFSTILIMANCCQKNIKTSQVFPSPPTTTKPDIVKSTDPQVENTGQHATKRKKGKRRRKQTDEYTGNKTLPESFENSRLEFTTTNPTASFKYIRPLPPGPKKHSLPPVKHPPTTSYAVVDRRPLPPKPARPSTSAESFSRTIY